MLLAMLSATPAVADGDDRPVNALAVKQQMILDRLARLEDRMFRLREKLAEAEPENAAKLQAALKRAGRLDVKTRIENLTEALRSSAALDDAADEQAQLLADLESVLNVLLDRNLDDEALRAERRRLAEIKQELDQIVRRQQALRQQTANAARAQRLARQVQAAQQQLEAILEQQNELQERTQSTEAADADAAQRQSAEQQRLAEQAERMTRELNRLSNEAQGLEAAQQNPGAEAPSQQTDNESNPASESLQQAAEQTRDGAEDMQAASDQRVDDRAEAVRKQQDAEDKLRDAIHRLEEAHKRLEAQGNTPKDAEAQRELSQRTHRLAERMQPAPSTDQGQDPNGETPDGGQSPDAPSDQQPQNEQTPGQPNVDRAQQHMDDAGRKLDEQDPADAVLEQDKALDELERAQRELEETLRQMRQEEKEETLRNIESRLQEMLAGQSAVNAETQPLSELGADNFSRIETLKCAELAARQDEVAKAAEHCVRLLEEDGTAIVFPQVMRQVAEDMRAIARRLGNQNVGRLTTSMQADVRATLDELLAALEKLREEMEQQKQQAGGAGAGGGAAGAPALVPTSAELKLLRTSQARINRQTATAADAREAGEAAPDVNAVLQRAADKQAELVEMARAMQQRAEKGP